MKLSIKANGAFGALLSLCALTTLGWAVGQAGGPQEPAKGTTSGKVLREPHRRVVFDSTPFSYGAFVGYWDKGFYITNANVEITTPQMPVVRLYDGSGNKVREASFWLPNSYRLFLSGLAVRGDGNIVISGGAEKQDGTRAYFIGALNAESLATHVLQTNPFRPSKVCAAPDGSVWSFGNVEDANGLLLRRFDFQKGQLSAYLARSSFNTRFPPAIIRGSRNNVFLRCTLDRVVVYTEVANEYIEVDYATETVRRWEIDRGADAPGLYGFAVTQSGDVYGMLGRPSDGLLGLFYLEVDRPTGKVRWLPVEGQVGDRPEPGRVARVLGAEGDAIVYMRYGEAAIVYWPCLRIDSSWRPHALRKLPLPSLNTLKMAVRDNELDPELFRLFVDAKVYQLIVKR